MANLLHLHLSSPSSSHLQAYIKRRYYSINCEIDLCPSIINRESFICYASRSRFKFSDDEDELFRNGFEFGFSKKKNKKPWWLDDDDDDDDDDWTDSEDDLSMIFEIFRTLSWILAPIGMSLILGTDSNFGLMALAVPLVQSVLSLVVDKALSRSNIRPMRRFRRETFSRSVNLSSSRRKKEENVSNGVDKGGYKSWIVGDSDSNSLSSSYGGWDDLDKHKEIRNSNVRPKQRFERRSTRPWRVKEKPLFLRMLIAAFPFLSSWTKVLF